MLDSLLLFCMVLLCRGSFLPLFRKREQNPENAKDKANDADRNEHWNDHLPHRSEVGPRLVLEGTFADTETSVATAERRHIVYGSAVVNVSDLFFFLLFVTLTHLQLPLQAGGKRQNAHHCIPYTREHRMSTSRLRMGNGCGSGNRLADLPEREYHR